MKFRNKKRKKNLRATIIAFKTQKRKEKQVEKTPQQKDTRWDMRILRKCCKDMSVVKREENRNKKMQNM
jgi:hypothetical protein